MAKIADKRAPGRALLLEGPEKMSKGAKKGTKVVDAERKDAGLNRHGQNRRQNHAQQDRRCDDGIDESFF